MEGVASTATAGSGRDIILLPGGQCWLLDGEELTNLVVWQVIRSHCTRVPSSPMLQASLYSAGENLKSLTPLSWAPARVPTILPSAGENRQISEAVVP